MRNVTIVESNVEPNKEHLWFYKGELKWFSPNGWEGVNKSSPTISPTSTKPLIAYIIFKSDAVSNAVINGERIPMNTPKAVIIDYYYSLTALTVPGCKFIGFYENEVKISSAEIIRYHVLPGVHNIELRYKRENEDLDSTTTSTPEPDPSATTTTTTSSSTTTRPPNGSGRKIEVYAGHGITHPLSTLMTSKDTLYDGLIDMEDKFYPLDEYNKAYYSTSGKYLAVVHSTEAKDTIVASIIVSSPSGSGEHTLYPKETAISGNTGHRFFLFDLSESPYLESTYDESTIYIELSAYTPDTISTIAPFIDGNIPPFADEK